MCDGLVRVQDSTCMNHFRINKYTALETRRRGHLAKECNFFFVIQLFVAHIESCSES